MTIDFQHEINRLNTIAASMLSEATLNDHVKRAAVARLAETEALLCMAAGVPYKFERSLGGLCHALDDTIKAIDAKNNRPIEPPAFESEDQQDQFVTAAVEMKEDCARWLDQARVTSTLALVHLSLALQAINREPTLKVVK